MTMLNRKSVFLLDGVGAVLSVFLSGAILPEFSDTLGLSGPLLYALAAYAALCMIYSFYCYFVVKELRGAMLRAIIAANLFYVFLSLVIILLHSKVTDWGKGLLGVEILAVLGVVTLEALIYRKEFRNR